MSHTADLDQRVARLGFWSVVIAVVTGVITLLVPLDVPGGGSAEHAERVVWLSANRGTFIAGWINQMVAMFSWSAAFACAAWQIACRAPLRAMLATAFVLMATMAFVIPKFIAIWTIPQLAVAIAADAAGSELAHSLLPLLNVSVPFSLYTTFDYLGFWLYSLFALLAAGPLYGQAISARVAAVTLGGFGVVYQLLLVALLFGAIETAAIETWFMSASLLVLFHIVAMGFVFRRSMSNRRGRT